MLTKLRESRHGGMDAICELTRVREPTQTLLEGGADDDAMVLRVNWQP